MKANFLPHPKHLSALIEEAYISFLQNSPGDLLARLALTLCLGIRISWAAKANWHCQTLLTIEFVETVGSFAEPHWDDWEPDIGLIDYVPTSSQTPPFTIEDCLEHWHITIAPFHNSSDGSEHLRRTQFQNLVDSKPGVRLLAVATLRARIDEDVRTKFNDIAEQWLYVHS